MSEILAGLFVVVGLILAAVTVLAYPTNVDNIPAIQAQAYVIVKILPPVLGSLLCFVCAITIGVWQAVSTLKEILPAVPSVPPKDLSRPLSLPDLNAPTRGTRYSPSDIKGIDVD